MNGKENEGKNEMLWREAINSARIALDEQKDTKELVIHLLKKIGRDVEKTSSKDRNVILTSVLMNCPNGITSEKVVRKVSEKIIEEEIFKKVYIISIQKNAYQEIVDFLNEEKVHSQRQE